MIASIVLAGYWRAPMFPPLPVVFSGTASTGAAARPARPRARRKLSLRRRIWGTFLPPWPKDE